MIWKIIFHNIREASFELERLRDRIVAALNGQPDKCRRGSFYEFEFFVAMEHAYHHVNWAWNCRHQDEQRAIRCDMEDFEEWEKFPAEFNEFWPSPSRCRGKAREPFDGRLYLMLSRIALDEAVLTIRDIYYGICKLLGEKIIERDPKTIEPMTEENFTVQMRHLYSCMNRAWNERKINLARPLEGSTMNVRRHSCYPRAFSGLWPECKCAS